MCPETLDDGGADYTSTQYADDEPTCVQRLAEPSQLLREAIIMIIHYQEMIQQSLVGIRQSNKQEKVFFDVALIVDHILGRCRCYRSRNSRAD